MSIAMESQVTASYDLIITEMDPRTGVLDGLISKNIISIPDAKRIRNEDKHNSARALMKYLYSKRMTNNQIFSTFVAVLSDKDSSYRDLANKIRAASIPAQPTISTPENERMKDRVRASFRDITTQVDPKYQVCDYLFKKGIIDHEKMNQINDLALQEDRTTYLLNYLYSGRLAHPTAFEAFVEALEMTEYRHLGRNIRGNAELDNSTAAAHPDTTDGGLIEFDRPPPPDFDVKVQHDLTFFEQHKDDPGVYPMTYIPRGKVDIINVQKDRDGTNIDRDKLRNLFRLLHLDVMVYNDIDAPCRDLSAKGILEIVERSVSEQRLEYDQCYILFIMSHGDLKILTAADGTKEEVQIIYGTDGQYVRINEIFQLLKNCKHLDNKPKLVFFNACRGGNLPEYDIKDDKLKDFLICYSTQKGYKSARWPDTGSWFPHSIVDVFMKKACNTDVVTMLNEVGREIHAKGGYHVRSADGKERRQIIDIKETLQKTLYLFP